MKNPTIIAVNGGFYLFGNLLKDAPDGFICMSEVAMFGGFNGGKGMPGVARGDTAMKVTLDRFEPSSVCLWPIRSVDGIYPSVDLYKFSGTVLR